MGALWLVSRPCGCGDVEARLIAVRVFLRRFRARGRRWGRSFLPLRRACEGSGLAAVKGVEEWARPAVVLHEGRAICASHTVSGWKVDSNATTSSRTNTDNLQLSSQACRQYSCFSTSHTSWESAEQAPGPSSPTSSACSSLGRLDPARYCTRDITSLKLIIDKSVIPHPWYLH